VGWHNPHELTALCPSQLGVTPATEGDVQPYPTVDSVTVVADEKGCRPGQLALARLLASRWPSYRYPAPGESSTLRRNAAALIIAIGADEVAYLADVFAPSG